MPFAVSVSSTITKKEIGSFRTILDTVLYTTMSGDGPGIP